MHFGFVLDPSNIDLWNIDLLDTNLDLFDADIHCKHFVCLQEVLKAYSRRLEDQQMFAGNLMNPVPCFLKNMVYHSVLGL